MSQVLDFLIRETADEDFDLLEAIHALAARQGWTEVLTETLLILQQPAKKEYWRQATAVIYWAVSRQAAMPVADMEVVARLYWCLTQYPGFGGSGIDDGENLVWSVASNLRGVRYLSDWDPMKDPEVQTFMATM